MSQNTSTAAIFSSFQTYLNEDQDMREEIRTVVRELEQKSREILTIVQGIHQPDGIKQMAVICEKARGQFEGIRNHFAELATKIPKDQYYRFHDHWRFAIQRTCFLAAIVVYLEKDKLITREETAAMLGVKPKREEGSFHLDLDDYLMGLLQLASELSRLAVNAVTAGDYGRPMKIAKFVAEMDSGFRLLNLKNDSLRKRFDGLKYDLKKVEEVVYDVTIRGLRPKEEEEATAMAQ